MTKKDITNKFISLVNTHGKNNRLYVFNAIAGEPTLASSTIDCIDVVGDKVRFMYNINEFDYDWLEAFKVRDLAKFYKDIKDSLDTVGEI